MAKVRSKQQSKEIGSIRRGEIYLVSFDPTVGHEIKKTRPALIIQNDIGNQYSPVTIVAAISSKFGNPPFPTEVILEPKDSGLPVSSAVVLNQLRSIDKQRLIKRVGKVNSQTMRKVEEALLISLGFARLDTI